MIVTREDLERHGYASRSRRRRRMFDMSVEMTLLLALLLVCVFVADAKGEDGQPWAAAPLPVTVTVVAPSKGLPEEIAEREIEVKQLAPLPFRELVGLVADEAGFEAVLQDRPGRVLDGDAALAPAVPFGLSMRGTVPQVLDELARLSGYDWGWEDGKLVFYRYGDIEQRRPELIPGGVEVGVLAALTDMEDRDAEGEAAEGPVEAGVQGELEPGRRPMAADADAAVEGQAPTVEAEAAPAGPEPWQVDPEAHGTVEGVLRAWAARAGWRIAWNSEQRFKVGAAAEFPAGKTEEAGFLGAADALLAIGPMRRTLTATAYPNRWLVVRDLGSAVQ